MLSTAFAPHDDDDVDEPKKTQAEIDALKKQELLMERLRAKGKVMINGDMKAVINGKVAQVLAYDPKEGKYIAQLPLTGQLAKVGPSLIIRLNDPPPIEKEVVDPSKYAHLKTW